MLNLQHLQKLLAFYNGSHYLTGMQAVLETHHFVRRAEAAGMSDVERYAFIEMVARNPEAGDVVQGTGGVRKVRFAAAGQGKSGSYRIITFFTGPDIPVFLITVYAKGDKATLTKGERNDLAKLTKMLADSCRRKVIPLPRIEAKR